MLKDLHLQFLIIFKTIFDVALDFHLTKVSLARLIYIEHSIFENRELKVFSNKSLKLFSRTQHCLSNADL